MKIISMSLYMDLDVFISSSYHKSGAWPSGKLRFEQVWSIKHSMVTCSNPATISVNFQFE